MTKRKPQITITEAERLALSYFIGYIAMDKVSEESFVKEAKETLIKLLDRSKRKEDF